MLSLANAFQRSDLDGFERRIREALGGSGSRRARAAAAEDAAAAGAAEAVDSIGYCAMPKFDGLAATLQFRGGRFVLGATRGDGSVGEDVTANLRTDPGVALVLDGKCAGVLEVRGEVLMLRPTSSGSTPRQAERGERCSSIPAMLRPAACASSIHASPPRDR